MAVQGGGMGSAVPFFHTGVVIAGGAVDSGEIDVNGLAYLMVAQRRRRETHRFGAARCAVYAQST